MKEITQRQLRNQSGPIMRALDRGESFLVTRNGVPVGELIPMRQKTFVRTEVAASVFASAPHVNAARFRRDVDALVDQGSGPRG